MKKVVLVVVCLAIQMGTARLATAQQTYDECTRTMRVQHPDWEWGQIAPYCNRGGQEIRRVDNWRPPVIVLQSDLYPPPPVRLSGSYGGYYDRYDNYGLAFLDPCRSYLPENSRPTQCTTAEVKFKFLDRGIRDEVIVRIDGKFAGMASKYANRTTSGLRLRDDQEYDLTLEWTSSKDGKIRTIEDRIEPMNIRRQDGPYWYPVSKARFREPAYGRSVHPVHEDVDGKKYITGR